MKRRITREHDARQAYDRVYWEGGSAITDADLNAAFDANRRHDETLARLWIAPAGTADDGWLATNLHSINVDGNAMVAFDLAAGHYTLDGEILTNPESYSFTDQPWGLSAALDDGMALAWPTPDEITEAGGERFDAVVLDSRALAVTVVEDSELDEVAMRSDPATRVRSSPKVRILPGSEAHCATARGEALDRLAGTCATVALPSPAIHPNARLRVHLGEVTAPENPCAPEQALGYFGRLNHTIKVMLTEPGRFVWAYRNSGELHRAMLDDNTTLRIVTPFADSSRFPVAGQIVELCSWDSRLPNGEVTAVALGRFHAVREGYRPGDETIELDTPVDADLRDWYDAQGTGTFLFARFWEPPAIAMETSTATGADVPLGETGVRLDFVVPGCPADQWSFSVRVNASDTVFPKRMLEPGGQPPGDIRRAADLIALIHWQIENGEVVGHLHDCRRRVRPLWQIRGCCTVTVGDGATSFGDVDRLDLAIEALPLEGGRICLLPGVHTGGVALTSRANVMIEGCRGQTRVVPGRRGGPVLRIEDCTDITLKDFTIEDGDELAVAAARNTRLALERIDTVGHGSAISLVESAGVRISQCAFLAEAEPSIIPAEDYAALRPLAFVGGRGIDIADNSFRCATSRLSLQSLGGLQIAGGSRDVRISGNIIAGGLGHGVTLGNLNLIRIIGVAYVEADLVADLGPSIMRAVDTSAIWTRNSREAKFVGSDVLGSTEEMSAAIEAAQDRIANATFHYVENPIGITQVAIQGCLGIDPTLTAPEPDDDDDDWQQYVPAGAVSHVHIIDNEISGMGGSGISIPSWNLSLRPTAGEVIVANLVVERNHIADCARVAVATTLDDSDLQEIGFGGIALQVVRGAKIGSNIIQSIGTDVRSPSVGIYIAEGHTCHIHDNQIAGIGRIERSGNRNILGVAGGVLIDDIAPVYGPPATGGTRHVSIDDLVSEAVPGAKINVNDYTAKAPELAQILNQPRTEALRIQNNQIAVNFGLSLDVRGAGSFHIADNHMATLAARPNPARARLASAVSVVNTELPGVEVLVLLVFYFRLAGITGFAPGQNYLLPLLATAAAQLGRVRDRGMIQFQNNHVRTENFVRGDDALSLVAVVSPHDTQISDNTLKSVHSDLGAYLHLIGVGIASLQCLSNRIETRPAAGVFGAALTAGIDNTTALNHASHPMAAIGANAAIPFATTNLPH